MQLVVLSPIIRTTSHTPARSHPSFRHGHDLLDLRPHERHPLRRLPACPTVDFSSPLPFILDSLTRLQPYLPHMIPTVTLQLFVRPGRLFIVRYIVLLLPQ